MPFARLHSQMVCTQSEPAEIPRHMSIQILVQVGGDRKRRTSRITLRTPTSLVIRDCFLVYCARTWRISFPPYLQMSETQIANELCMGTCVALSIFCLNIALLCIPLNTFETWADQQELSKEARCKSAFSTRRRVSLLESSMLLNNLMEARNQKNCIHMLDHAEQSRWHSTTTQMWPELLPRDSVIRLRKISEGNMQPRTVPGLQLFCSMPKMPQNKWVSVNFITSCRVMSAIKIKRLNALAHDHVQLLLDHSVQF